MMKNKSLRLFGLGALVLLTLMSLVSAVPVITNVSTTTLSQTSGSFTMDVNGSLGETITLGSVLTSPYLTNLDANGKNISFSFNPLSVTGGATATSVIVSYTVDSGFVFETGKTYSVTLTAIGTTTATKTLSFAQTIEPTAISSCKVKGNSLSQNNLKVLIDNIKVVNGFGDDTEWYPLDEIEVKVDVENNGNDTIRNVVVEWQLYDKTAQRKILDGEESSFSLKEDDAETLTINFKLDSARLKSGNEYVLYVWANGRDESFTGSPSTCFATNNVESLLGTLDIAIDSHFVILDSLEILGTASCGNTVQVSGEVWNIGEEDEGDVYLKVFNTQLGISQTVTVGDIDNLESKDLLFNVVIPEDAEEGSYDLTFLVYDDSDDIFENSNGDEAEFTLPLVIASGSCSAEVPASVTATVETSPKAGEEFTVKVTITNTASTAKTFTLELNDFATWSSLVSVDKSSFALNAGQSGEALIKLKVNEGVSGSKSFNVFVKEGSKTLVKQVPVSVQGVGFNLTGWFSNLGLEGNAYLWVIGALNVLLVLVIIVVAVRVVRKKQ